MATLRNVIRLIGQHIAVGSRHLWTPILRARKGLQKMPLRTELTPNRSHKLLML
jgi:hypothetical protein